MKTDLASIAKVNGAAPAQSETGCSDSMRRGLLAGKQAVSDRFPNSRELARPSSCRGRKNENG